MKRFWRELPRQTIKAIFSFSIFSWIVRTEMQVKENGERLTQYRLAIAELSLLRLMLFLLIVGKIFLFVPNFGFSLVNDLGQGDFIFLLGDNRLQGVLLGYSFGMFGVILSGRVWLPTLITLFCLRSGILALNVGWGVWLGLLPGIWLIQIFSSISSIRGIWRRWLIWKTLLSFLVFGIVFVFAGPMSEILRSMFQSSTALDARMYQWLCSGLLTLFLSLGLSAIFFHIYFWLFGQKH